jgi:tryptophan-rich sensory protein
MTLSLSRALNALTFVAVVALNGAAATGAMSGDSIGVLANRYPSLFLPANYVFGIWSLIYAGLCACLAYQLGPSAGGRRTVERLGPWWAVCGALNVAWITLFSFSQFGAAMLVMLAFLAVLVLVGERLRAEAVSRTERVLAVWPHDLYLAWIAVAVIANSFQYAHAVGFGGFGVPEATWAVGMMGVATLLGAVMAHERGNWLFPLVVAWALRGIGARHAAVPAIADATAWLVPAGIALGLAAWGGGVWGGGGG